MKIYLAEHTIGSFAFDESGNLLDYVLNPKELGKVVDILINVEKGEPMPSTMELIQKLKPSEVVVESETESSRMQSLGVKVVSKPHHVGARALRGSLAELAVKAKFAENPGEVYNFLYQVSLEYTRRKLRKAAQKRDLLAIQAIRAIDDIDKTINLFSERLREWYSIHFPEADKLIEDHEQYAKVVSLAGYRDNVTVETLTEIGLNEQKAKKLADAAKKSIGADISDADINSIRDLANTILSLFKLRNSLYDYLDSIMREVAPNVTELVGPTLGARLLSLAGSLEELSKMPASTIQVLGAEKALFRALKSGSRPPKHGIIFQYPAIHVSPRWQRGKIARALAAKLAIASRIDAYSGRFVGTQLVEQVNKRIEEIKTKYAQPPPKKQQPKEEGKRFDKREHKKGKKGKKR
ncbi:putative NOP5 family protein [Metallosphaera sp. J1]|uniref:C/D box methylation guide ribonucleoprotein complex aNOP56 subunit n=1 Tax=Metallosphaera TaxID=41980 RepID=UPI001EDDC3F1|nr:C/D box methylation guide ribonucleoprotein complex aNOP56 subunit [Metallosphaera javensis (ex Hofmann et al. 2022)]MCG3108826.1 putative NOP5 family protein [Metallosphaera javensis (ex Hofmann et al. 2022)]BCS94241.1 MAG: putative NOP5 family protein [Metallosphaera javensis (ex Sakai et al. 2022)]